MTSPKNVAVITGASTGIGHALAGVLASDGYQVALIARSADKLDSLCEEINSKHGDGTARSFPLDVREQSKVVEVVSAIHKHFGRIDVLVNNAGLALGSPKPFQDQTVEELDTVIGTNVMGPIYLTHAVLNAAMLKQGPNQCGEGDIVNVSSITGLDPPPMGEASYHTSKTAIEGFSNVLRQELSGSNIRVLVVRPGFVGGSAEFHAVRHNQPGADPSEAQDAKEATFEGVQPLMPEDVAETILAQLKTPRRISLRAVDIVPTPQRSMYVLDRKWNERNSIAE